MLRPCICLINQWLRGGGIYFHHVRVTGCRGFYMVLRALPWLNEQIFDLIRAAVPAGCSQLKGTMKFHRNQSGFLAADFQRLGGLGKVSCGLPSSSELQQLRDC
ncbi:hypothetical protein MRX96_024537 [Rhipicephalus microplus]